MPTLHDAQAALAENSSEFSTQAPAQYAKMKRVLELLKKAPSGTQQSAEMKGLVAELLQWQFGSLLEEYQTEHAALKKQSAAHPDPAIDKEAAAVAELISFLTEARSVGVAPSAKAIASMEARLPRLQKAFSEASDAAAHSTVGIPMRPLRRPIVSASGVPLRAVEPPPRQAAGPVSAAPSKTQKP